jgi:hypothetical protein
MPVAQKYGYFVIYISQRECTFWALKQVLRTKLGLKGWDRRLEKTT